MAFSANLANTPLTALAAQDDIKSFEFGCADYRIAWCSSPSLIDMGRAYIKQVKLYPHNYDGKTIFNQYV